MCIRDRAGTLLIYEATYESVFETTNCVDSQKMERWDSEMFSAEQKKAAYFNEEGIRNNIKKLVLIFKRKDMRDKLTATFGSFKNNDIANYKTAYERLKKLYMVKNGTSLEEHTTTQEQLKEMKITTEALAQTLRQK